jgi:hypothetical protein
VYQKERTVQRLFDSFLSERNVWTGRFLSPCKGKLCNTDGEEQIETSGLDV